MLEYRIIEEDNLLDTQTEVNKAIKEGWKPLGGISTTFALDKDDWYQWFTQAMIRETPEQTRATILTEYYQEKGK